MRVLPLWCLERASEPGVRVSSTSLTDALPAPLLPSDAPSLPSFLFTSQAGVEVKYKIVVDELETTSQKNIFAIGDCALKRAELTPIAIQAGT